MQTVTVKKAELLEIVKQNRAKHGTLYNDAREVFKQDMLTQLKKATKELKKADPLKDKMLHSVSLQLPVQYLSDYDRATKMLEMSVDDEIDLEDHEFRQLVLDEWGWKDHFVGSTMSYSVRNSKNV